MRTKESNAAEVKRHRRRMKRLGEITHSLNVLNGRTKCNRTIFDNLKIADESNCLVCNKQTINKGKEDEK